MSKSTPIFEESPRQENGLHLHLAIGFPVAVGNQSQVSRIKRGDMISLMLTNWDFTEWIEMNVI